MPTIAEIWIAEGKAEGVLDLLNRRFHSVPSDLETKIKSITDLSILADLLYESAVCESLGQFQQSLDAKA